MAKPTYIAAVLGGVLLALAAVQSCARRGLLVPDQDLSMGPDEEDPAEPGEDRHLYFGELAVHTSLGLDAPALLAGEARDGLRADEQLITLREVSVMTGNGFTPSAVVKLEIRGEEAVGTGVGVGPVDAASVALQEALETHVGAEFELCEYGLKAITGGTNALANAHIRFADKDGNKYRGEAIGEDVILASLHAMVKGANRALGRSQRAVSKEQ